MGRLSPVQMLFILSTFVAAIIALVVVVAALRNQLDVIVPIVATLVTALGGFGGGIVLFIKVSEPRDKP